MLVYVIINILVKKPQSSALGGSDLSAEVNTVRYVKFRPAGSKGVANLPRSLA